MRIDVRSRTTRLSQSLRSIVERRVLFTLTAISEPIDSVVVTVDDGVDAQGAVTKRCGIEARGPNVGLLSVEDSDVDAYAALHGALRQLRQGLLRAA